MPRKYIVLLGLALTVIVLDQWSKYWVVDTLTTHFDGLTTVGERVKALYRGVPETPGYYGLHLQPKRVITLSESFFRLRYAENPGAAWGLFRSLPPHVRGPLFHVVSLGAVLLITFYFRQLSGKDSREKWALWGLPLVLGGALGNYMDRLARGFVIDFIEAHWHDKATWPSFNVADAAICVGVGMLLLDSLVRKEKEVATPVAV